MRGGVRRVAAIDAGRARQARGGAGSGAVLGRSGDRPQGLHQELRGAEMSTDSWLIFRGDNAPANRLKNLPPPPSWRSLRDTEIGNPVPPEDLDSNAAHWRPQRGKTFRLKSEVLKQAVNAALYLRRPLLLTGQPGTGKSSLIYAVAYELGMGPVLKWPITSRSTLKSGEYEYDALRRLNDIRQKEAGASDD